jgi:hypothetical protein
VEQLWPSLNTPDWHIGPRTRRQLLAGGALALGAAATAELAGWTGLLRTGSAPAAAVPRCVSLGANGVINPGSSQDYRSCRAFLRETRTRWVRIWADWPSLQPEGDLAPDRGSGAWRLPELDRQIAQANADGVKVILTAYRFPTWANGTDALGPLADVLHRLEDRVPRPSDVGQRKDLRFKLPPDVGPGSAWARWIQFLIARYRTRIAALELVNEPNAQVWPLQGPSLTGDPYDQGPLTSPRVVAQMFQTAQSIAAAHPHAPLLIGPATSDTSADSRLAIPFDKFTRALLDELDRIGFEPGPGFAWAHHNYTDVEHDEGARAAGVRQLLTGRWTGWPHADPSTPAILIPEGGARLSKIASIYSAPGEDEIRAIQAKLIRRNWSRMAGQPGVAMLGQYLFYSDPTFDCGLCDADGAKRPAYAAWGALPSA